MLVEDSLYSAAAVAASALVQHDDDILSSLAEQFRVDNVPGLQSTDISPEQDR